MTDQSLEGTSKDRKANLSAEGFFKRGVEKEESNDPKGAIDDLTKAISLNPNLADAYGYRGSAKEELEDYEGAISDYNKALEINPDDARLYNDRGHAKGMLGDIEGAIDDNTKSLEIDPSNTTYLFNRGFLRYKLGDEFGGCEDWKKATSLGDESSKEMLEKYCISDQEEKELILNMKEEKGDQDIESPHEEIIGEEKVYESDESNIFTSGDSVLEHRTRLNNMLLEFFEFTPFAETQSVPTMLTSENEDKTINFSCCRGTPEKPAPPASCYYTVFHEGKVKVKETNEVLNMNDMSHLFLIVTTIIKDIYGDFDTKEATEKYMNSTNNSGSK